MNDTRNTPSMAQMRNRFHDGHSAVLRSIITGTALMRPTLFHLRSEQTLRRWGCLANDGTVTARGLEFAAAIGIEVN